MINNNNTFLKNVYNFILRNKISLFLSFFLVLFFGFLITLLFVIISDANKTHKQLLVLSESIKVLNLALVETNKKLLEIQIQNQQLALPVELPVEHVHVFNETAGVIVLGLIFFFFYLIIKGKFGDSGSDTPLPKADYFGGYPQNPIDHLSVFLRECQSDFNQQFIIGFQALSTKLQEDLVLFLSNFAELNFNKNSSDSAEIIQKLGELTKIIGEQNRELNSLSSLFSEHAGRLVEFSNHLSDHKTILEQIVLMVCG